MRSDFRKTQRAFTLIELLVVIAIIAILAAILFPVFARARENARRASCQSNLKQVALGIFQYTQDYDEKYPLMIGGSGSFAPNTAGYSPWGETVQPYLKSTQLYQCPSETNPPVASGNDYGYMDYGMNTFQNTSGGTYSGFSVAAVEYPSLSVMVFELGNGYAANGYSGCNDWNCTADVSGDLANLASSTSTNENAKIHLDGANYAFADGHVKWFKGSTATQSPTIYNGVTPPNGTRYSFRAN